MMLVEILIGCFKDRFGFRLEQNPVETRINHIYNGKKKYIKEPLALERAGRKDQTRNELEGNKRKETKCGGECLKTPRL